LNQEGIGSNPIGAILAPEITYHGPGEDAKDLQIGDFLLTRGENRNAKLIRFGQGIEHGFDNPVREVNHEVLCLGGDESVEALADGVIESYISWYRDSRYAIVRTNLNDHDQAQVFDYAYSVMTSKYKYGYWHIASIAFNMLTGSRFFFGLSESEICSGFVAGALTRGGFIWDKPPSHMTPADLALHFGVHLPKVVS
jgi:hypothetical protein